MVTDNIGDFIIRLKNGNFAGKESVSVYYSKNKAAIADTLVRAGFIKSFSKSPSGKMLDVVLAYKADKSPKITGAERVSKPSRRVYYKSADLRPFKSGFGAIILSTPYGIFSNKEAFKKEVGGEALFKIW